MHLQLRHINTLDGENKEKYCRSLPVVRLMVQYRDSLQYWLVVFDNTTTTY